MATKTIAELRTEMAAAQQARDWKRAGEIHHEIIYRGEHERNMAQRDREVAAGSMSVAEVSARSKQLQGGDKGLAPGAQAVYRDNREGEVQAIGERTRQLNAPPGSSGTADPLAAAKEAAREEYRQRMARNPMLASAWAVGKDHLLFGDPNREPPEAA